MKFESSELLTQIKKLGEQIGAASSTTETINALFEIVAENQDLKAKNEALSKRSSGSEVEEVTKKFKTEITDRDEELVMIHSTNQSLMEKMKVHAETTQQYSTKCMALE
jgi:regulator of replication initiation timing